MYAKEILDETGNPNIINSVNRRSALSYACEYKWVKDDLIIYFK